MRNMEVPTMATKKVGENKENNAEIERLKEEYKDVLIYLDDNMLGNWQSIDPNREQEFTELKDPETLYKFSRDKEDIKKSGIDEGMVVERVTVGTYYRENVPSIVGRSFAVLPKDKADKIKSLFELDRETLKKLLKTKKDGLRGVGAYEFHYKLSATEEAIKNNILVEKNRAKNIFPAYKESDFAV